MTRSAAGWPTPPQGQRTRIERVIKFPLPSREREGPTAKRWEGEGTAKDERHDPGTTLTRLSADAIGIR
ncbi:hypothetical protein CHT98_31030 (plasmid) [Azospirillum brasilense]|uniref:Uncharacterized protein n=1 Tax=Azospirillum brasilense TaxID=192 RepID=A0A235H3Q5_AZOBR|nr:hypothetical protein CHT98_31030 [Azospirillum brasilense]